MWIKVGLYRVPVSRTKILLFGATMNTMVKHCVVVQLLQERGLCASLMTGSDRHCSIAGYVSEQKVEGVRKRKRKRKACYNK